VKEIEKKSGIRSLAVPEFFWRAVPRCNIVKVLFINPAAFHLVAVVKLPDIGFDVNQRRPIQDINTFYFQNILFHLKEPDNREPQRVWAVEVPDGKDTALFFPVKEWFLEKAYVRCPIETVQQVQVRERFDVTQAFGEFREDLNIKENELISIALGIEQKNELLEQISNTLKNAVKSENDKIPVKQILSTIKAQLSDDRETDLFNQQFSALHKEFFANLTLAHPDLTKTELKFCAYLRVQLSSSQIANIMNVTSEAIRKTRYRIRKKMNLPVEASLESYIMKF